MPVMQRLVTVIAAEPDTTSTLIWLMLGTFAAVMYVPVGVVSQQSVTKLVKRTAVPEVRAAQ